MEEPEISEASFFGRNNLDIYEKFCPVCRNKNEREAIVCRYCGASLETYFTDSAESRTTEMQTEVPEKIGELRIDEALIAAGGIALYVAGTSDRVFLYSAEEFVIGRKVEETSESFLDLSELGGFQLGLSKRHATIRRAELGYEAIDLSSSNGTWLNDERLIPNKPYPMASGSRLRLGQMRFFVLYRPVLETRQKM